MEEKQRLINFRPLCIAAAFFAVGIACAYFARFEKVKGIICFSVLVIISLVCIVFIAHDRKRASIFLAIFAGIFCIGYGYSTIKIQSALAAETPITKGSVEATIDVISYTNSGLYKITFRDVEAEGQKLSGGAMGFFKSKGLFVSGQRYRFDCSIANRLDSEDVYFDAFCDKPFMISHLTNAEYVCDRSRLSEHVAARIEDVIKSGMSEDGCALALALVLGDTSMMGERLNLYRMAGISHAFSVSGLHVGLFIALFAMFASLLKLKKINRALFILVPTLFYSFICGFRPSAVRALIMGTVIILANEIGFKRDILSSIALALLVVLCIQPFYLFDYGARLSFLAVTGIAVISPVCKRLLKPLGRLGEPLSITIGAWLFTLPILTNMSGYISIISIFANLLFVPILSLAYQFTVIMVLLGLIENIIFKAAAVTLFLPSAILSAIGSFVEVFNFSLFVTEGSFGFVTIFYYIGMFFVTDLLNISKSSKAIIATSAFFLTILFMFIK